jgi:hypothetical protein
MEKINLSNFLEIKDKNSYIKWLIKDNSIEILFSYVSDFSNAKKLRDIVFSICEILELGEKVRNRIIVVIDELNNNAIEYGSKFWDINKLKFIIKQEEKWIYINIEVIDSWKWAFPKTALEMKILKEKKLKDWFEWYHSIRWRGLFMIIINIVDKLYFKDSKDWGLIVWIEKTIK